ncbi:LPS-assembly protein LptD [bacterium]|nr:LPS-assembly protein LptD [bacterium]
MRFYNWKSIILTAAMANAMALFSSVQTSAQSLLPNESEAARVPGSYPPLRLVRHDGAPAAPSASAAFLPAAVKPIANTAEADLPGQANPDVSFYPYEELFLFGGYQAPQNASSPFYSPTAAILDLAPHSPWERRNNGSSRLFAQKNVKSDPDSQELKLEGFSGYFGNFYTCAHNNAFTAGPENEDSAGEQNVSPEDVSKADSSAALYPEGSGMPVHLTADKISADEESIIAEGSASIDMMGARLLCERLILDRTTGKITASDNCVIYWHNNFAAADWLTYDPNSRIAVMHNVAGQGSDFSASESKIDGDLFFWAETLQWTDEKMVLSNAAFTTCDKTADNLDYKFTADHAEIYPQDRLIASNTAVYLHKTHLYTLPTLSVPLDNKRRGSSNIIPQIGRNTTDGWFMRNSFDYVFDNLNYGTLYLDYYSKTGIGGGLQQYYTLGGDKGHGDFYYYRLSGSARKNSDDLNSNIYYDFDDENKIYWEFSSNRSSVSGGDNESKINSHFNFTHKDEKNDLRLSHNYNTKGEYNRNTTWRMYYDLQLTPELSTTWKAELSTIATRARTAQRFYYYGSLRHTSELFDTELMMENTTGDANYTLNRNPEFRLRTQPVFIGDVPFTASAAFGHVTESPSMFSTDRYDVQLQIPDQTFEYGSGRILAGAGFRQLFYGSGESMYSLAARLGWMQELGECGTIRLDYNWFSPQGETPIQYDFMNAYENLTGGIEFFQDDVFNLAVTSGYSFKSNRFQNVTPRLQLRPGKDWLLGAGCSYDPNTATWRNIDTHLKFQISDELSVCHWSIYDLVNSRFTYQDYQLDYETHDWISSLVYRSVQNEFYFQFSLKAFPQPAVDIGPNSAHNIVPKNRRNAFVHY